MATYTDPSYQRILDQFHAPVPKEEAARKAAEGGATIGPAPVRREPPEATIGPARSDYVQPKHEQVMTGAALSALAAANPVSALPMAGKLGHDLALEGTAAFSDPANVAALMGIMTYGASAVRLGANAPLMRKMVAAGEPLPKIRRMTGYEPGPFGMGAETPGDASLRASAVFRPQGASGTLGELGYVHSSLERAYPGMAQTPVEIVPSAKWAATVAEVRTGLAEWSRGNTTTGMTANGRIYVRGKMPGETMAEYVERSNETLVHELQHKAQTLDGLRAARVHATRDEYLRDAREVDARNSAERSSYLPQERMLIPRRVTQDVAPEDVRQDAKGGDHANFRNFLATDDVPESIFGYPVVQDESGYTESDLEFFRANPKAAGFYDLGDGETAEEPPSEPAQDDKGGRSADQVWAERNPTLVGHVKSFEKLRLKPYEDVGGYAIGYGAHVNYDGAQVTKDTAAITEAQADAMLARDLYARREALAKALPNWKSIPGAAKQALLDVSMGVDGVLSAKSSPGLHADLAAAGEDPDKLLDAVKRHYYTYRTSKDPKDQKGLENRRVAGGRLFFGEDFSYEGKAWDAVQRKFVPKGGK